MAQTCTGSRTRMMPTSSEDGTSTQQHAAPPTRTELSKMNEGHNPARGYAPSYHVHS